MLKHIYELKPDSDTERRRSEAEMTATACLEALCQLLLFWERSIVAVEAGKVVVEEKGRQKEVVWRWTYQGSPEEMRPLLLVAYFYFDGCCALPPPAAQIEPQYLQFWLKQAEELGPRRDQVASFLRDQGITPLSLEDALPYDDRYFYKAALGFAIASGVQSHDLKLCCNVSWHSWKDFVASVKLAQEGTVSLAEVWEGPVAQP